MAKKLSFIYVVFTALSAFSLTTSAQAESESAIATLDLANYTDLFAGDWLDAWEDPHDERFKDIDLKAFFSQRKNEKLREKIYNMRQKFIKKYYQMEKDPNADYIELGKEMTAAYKQFTSDLFKEIFDTLLIPDSEAAFVSFGSMARGESGPITDLEGALLLDQKVVGKNAIGQIVATMLAHRLNGLIGHPAYGRKGFRLDEAENAPPHHAPFVGKISTQEKYCMAVRSLAKPYLSEKINEFRAQYFFPWQGSFAYLTTPQKLGDYVLSMKKPKGWSKRFMTSRYLQPEHFEEVLKGARCVKNLDLKEVAERLSEARKAVEEKVIKAFTMIGRNHGLVFGNQDLYDHFVAVRNKHLDDNNGALRKRIVFDHLKTFPESFGTDQRKSLLFGSIPDVFDLKRVNYRFIEQLLTDLSMLYDLKVQNPKDIISKLTERGIFGRRFAKSLLEQVNQMTRLRWKGQIIVDGQTSPRLDFLSLKGYNSTLHKMHKQIEANDKIIASDHSTTDEVRMAKANNIELKQDLHKMPKLKPEGRDSIFSPKEIAYISEVLIPEQVKVMRRLIAFNGNDQDRDNFPPNKNAFKDDFDESSVKLRDYNIRTK